jgi:hypothetical protein
LGTEPDAEGQGEGFFAPVFGVAASVVTPMSSVEDYRVTRRWLCLGGDWQRNKSRSEEDDGNSFASL